MNTRFAVAAHALIFIGLAPARLVNSDELAASIDTHPALVRRLLSLLREAGLVQTRLGPGGGARLALPPERISLLQVYDAVGAAEDLFSFGRLSSGSDCSLSAGIRGALQRGLSGPEQALRMALQRVSIGDLLVDAAPPAAAAPVGSNPGSP